jgi:stage II sporulation protein AA (anti-sigma F factor antagonist)
VTGRQRFDGLVVTVQGAEVQAVGELDLDTAARLDDVLQRLCHGAHRQVTLDLTGLTFCDCAGLRVLLTAHRTLRSGGGRLVLAHPNAALSRLLAITGLAGELELLH